MSWVGVKRSAAWMILRCLSLAVLLQAGTVQAQENLVLRTRGPAAWIDVEALRVRLAELVGTPVVSISETRASVLSIARRDEHHARVELVRVDGRRIARTVTLPDEPSERVETLAILAVNLLRDEAAELLAMLRPRPEDADPIEPDAEAEAPPEVEAAPEAETVPEETVPEETVPADTVEEETAPEVETVPEEVVPAEAVPAEAVPAEAVPEEATIPPEIAGPPGPPFLRIGAAAHLGSVPSGAGYDVDLVYGFELAWTAPEVLAIGLRELAVGGLPQGRDGIRVDLAPFIELGWTYAFFTLYGQLGAHAQIVVDFGVNEHFAVAPLGVLGIRFRVAPIFSIGLETALRVVASEQFTTALHDLPQLSVPWTAGLSLLFHVS